MTTVMHYSVPGRIESLDDPSFSAHTTAHAEDSPQKFTLWHRIQAVCSSANCCTSHDVDENIDDGENHVEPAEGPSHDEVHLEMAPHAFPHPDSPQCNCKSENHREAVIASLSSSFTSSPPQKPPHIRADGLYLHRAAKHPKSSLKSARPLSVLQVHPHRRASDSFPGFPNPPTCHEPSSSSSEGITRASPRYVDSFQLSTLACRSPVAKASPRGRGCTVAQTLAPDVFHSPVPSPTSNSIYYRALDVSSNEFRTQPHDRPVSIFSPGQAGGGEKIEESYFIEVPVEVVVVPPKVVDEKPVYPLERLFEGAPRSSLVGGVMSNLLKMFVRRKMDSCGKVQVSIGGNSIQLLSGKSTGFRVYMQHFCFEGAWTTEAEAHTLGEGRVISFNVNSARMGGKLFSERVPMMLCLRTSQEDAIRSLKPSGNKIIRNVLQECWNHINGHPVGSYPGGEATQESTPDFPLPLPTFLCKFTGGLGLYAEEFEEESTNGENGVGKMKVGNACADQKRVDIREGEDEKPSSPLECIPRRLALKFLIEKVDGREMLVLEEADWPEGGNVQCKPLKAHCKWRKVVDLPSDIKFDTCVVDDGWFSYSYTFDLDL